MLWRYKSASIRVPPVHVCRSLFQYPVRDAALRCIGKLFNVLGEEVSGVVLDLMGAMFRTGNLNQPLLDTLVTFEYSPHDQHLSAQFKQRLITEIANILQVRVAFLYVFCVDCYCC